MSTLNFNIAQYHAVSPRFFTPETWSMWANSEQAAFELPEIAPDISFMPAMQRRRLGLSARMIFSAVHPLINQTQDIPIVFVSHDGEINRSFQMLLKLFGENEVSPTAFGLSVHNALIGQLSMWYKNMAEGTAISVREAGWEIGIVEACSLLAEGADKVLLLCADEPLIDEYTVKAIRSPFPYAIAALITAENTWALTRQIKKNTIDPHYWGALSWLKNHLLHKSHWEQHYSQESWLWKKIN